MLTNDARLLYWHQWLFPLDLIYLDQKQKLIQFFSYNTSKIPWIHVETEDTHEKEPEMISAVGQEKNGTRTTATSFTTCSTHTSFPSNTGTHNSFSHLPPPRELMEKELEAHNTGEKSHYPIHNIYARFSCVVVESVCLVSFLTSLVEK